jgi:pimeloyl-ACP methyl ester carboxylesterase
MLTRVALLLMLAVPALAGAQMARVGEYHVEYQIAGQGDLTVVLEAGGASTMHDWDPVFDAFSRHARVLRYSRVGNGRSTAVQGHFAVEDYANHLEHLLRAVGIGGRLVYVAHSYGANVARTFAARHPDRIQAILLIEPASEHDVDIMRAIDLERANEEIARVKLEDIANGKVPHITDFWAKFPLPDHPDIPDVPVTVIASVKRYDQPANLFFSDEGRASWGRLWTEWVEAFPRGRIVLTSGSYHFPHHEEVDMVVREYRALLERAVATER